MHQHICTQRIKAGGMNDFGTSGQNNLSAIKRNPGLPEGSIENKRVLIEIYIRKCKNKKMRKKLKETALLATIDIKGLDPKLGSDGFLALNAVFQIEPDFDNYSEFINSSFSDLVSRKSIGLVSSRTGIQPGML